MANLFSIPTYIPDSTSIEVVTGYQVQYNNAAAGLPPCSGTWSDIPGSPFVNPHNIVDTTVANTVNTYYRARPVRTANGTTLDTAWSKPFLPTDALYDIIVTRFLLPQLRFVYLHDEGKGQTNGTVLSETTGAGNGVWVPDGTNKRFPVQWVENDDPVKILDKAYTLIHTTSGGSPTTTMLVPDQDYSVDLVNGVVNFATPPTAGDYYRFDFRIVDFLNDELLQVIRSGINGLSHFGVNGYGLTPENNLWSLLKVFPDQDIAELIARIGVYQMREGQTEYGLRSSFAWRDGGVNVDPYPSRALEFLVQKLQVSEKAIQNQANAYIKATTRPRVRGDYDLQFDMSQMTPVTRGMFTRFSAYFGMAGSAGMGFIYPWWL